MRLRSPRVVEPRSPSRARQRVEALILKKFGRIEEDLVGSGLLDSLRTIELALQIEAEFGVSLDDLTLEDLGTISALTKRLVQVKPGLDT